DDAGRQTLDRRELLRHDRALAVNRLAQRVDDASEQRVADRDGDDAAGPLDRIAFFDLLELAEEPGADALLFQVQPHAEHAVRDLEHLARHRVLDAVHARDAVADRDDAAHFGDIDVDGEAPDLFADDLGYLVSFNVYLHALHEPFFHLFQLPRHRSVIDR